MKSELYMPGVPAGQSYESAPGIDRNFLPVESSRCATEPDRLAEAVRAHLNIMFRPRFYKLWVGMFASGSRGDRLGVLRDQDLRHLPGWSDQDENQLLIVFAAACGLGLLTYEQGWRFTGLDWNLTDQVRKEGKTIDGVTHADAVAWWMDPEKLRHPFMARVQAAWKTLLQPFVPRLLRRWSSAPCGFEHQHAHIGGAEAGVDRERTLAALAAAATVGAMRYTGRRWVPDISAAAWAQTEYVQPEFAVRRWLPAV